MSKFNFASFFSAALVIMLSCIEEIEVFKGSTPSLVVDGTITDEPGPHKVRLSISKEYNQKADFEPVREATVKIVDDLGNEELLTYTDYGVFVSRASFSGVVGRSYRVTITLENGNRYESVPELLAPVPAIDAIRYEASGDKLTVYGDFTDDVESVNFYRWRHSATYEVLAPVALEMSKTNQRHKNSDCISWSGPPPFAKDVVKCWAKDYDNEFLKIESDELFNGRSMKEMKLFSLDLNTKFDRGYSLDVKQYSISQAAYEYWKAIKVQMANNGTVFETNNYQILGNIRSLDTNEVVLGFFSASAVSSEQVFVYEYMGMFGDVPCEINNSGCYPERCMDCRRFAVDATNIKPDYWPY